MRQRSSCGRLAFRLALLTGMLLVGVLWLLLASERAQAKAQGATMAGLLTQIAQLRTELRQQEQLAARAVHEQHTAEQQSADLRRYKEQLLPTCQRAKSTAQSAEAKALKELALARRSAEDAEAELQMLAEERDGHSSALLDATAQLRDCLTSARAHAHARCTDESAGAAPDTRSAAAATALLGILRGHTKHGVALAQQSPIRPQEVGEEVHQTTDDASPQLPPSPPWEGEACMDVGGIADGGDVPPVKMRVFVNDGPGGAIDYSHMAMIAQTPPHCPWRWILMWQSSHGIEGTDDQHFRVAFSHDAVNWSAPLVMSLTEGGPVWGPVLHVQGDVIWLFYSESIVCKRLRDPVADAEKPVRWCPGGDLKYVQSHDGMHWTSPVTIHPQAADGVPKVVANQLVVTPTGRWVLPFWSEPPRSEPSPECPSEAPHTSGVLLSDNQGRTWRPSAVIQDARTWLIEGTVAALHNGTLLQLFRTGLGAVFQSVSTDDGDTWSVPIPTSSLPNPNAKLNLIRLAGSDTLAVAYNHAGGPPPMPRFRSNLFVALSEDSGGSWHKVAALESMQTHATQWHYPTLAQDGCRLLVAYSSLHRYSSFGPEDVDDVVGGIHLAEVDLRRADVSPATKLPDIDWFAPPVDEEFDIEIEDLTEMAALTQQQHGNGEQLETESGDDGLGGDEAQ